MERNWWKEAVAYQIYPRSFNDSNNDGIGDLKGIVSKLDYLKNLGIDVIWICPMYKSPNDDNGYDISDYQDIMADFGTMNEFDELLKEVHKRDMKLIIDLVINHTSDEHEWFIESKSSKNNPKRDWYIWDKDKCGREPNNWESIFKGSAWELDEVTEEYFLHLFTKRQPDLNWENEEVRAELYKMINWWLDKGIDGFRVDAISHIKKEDGLVDMPNPQGLEYVSSFEKHMNVNGIHEYLEELNENTFSKYEVMTVGEANGVSADEAHLWVGNENGKFNMLFQFEHLQLWDDEKNEEFNVKKYKGILTKWQKALEGNGWNALFIENHDIPRVVSRWGNDKEFWRESATAFALMYFMQQGTPFIYQGQEIGMTNVKFDSIDDYDDIQGINIYEEKLGQGLDIKEAMNCIGAISRDNARTPMQWNSSKNAGFTTNEPWIKINENYKEINVEAQGKDEKSILSFYKKMIKTRKNNLALVYGVYDLILEDDENIYAYTRTLNGEKYVIIVNLSTKETKYFNKDIKLNYDKLLINNYDIDVHEEITEFTMKPYESRLYKI
ncbi:alpha-glucosidase [Clostridium gasigenes]|uniref:glycoside hydrolase family 13 protein n=1 Tax=Clostridium gasigenes TaxID=94869 RepID=UPI0016288EF3|nr:alpha-glucosidase [Clostridium gasigenes]MBB6623305.1 alpha-glucosidase [Clostridium gasigenes]MBU3088070.1 alpha-glucosidase [Clostridium gasigenes]MBU3107854.1 alpha-glucosidase [Clostridium gasigenes]